MVFHCQKCGLIEQVFDRIADPDKKLQNRPIRSKCRSYAKEKSLARAPYNEVLRNLKGSIV